MTVVLAAATTALFLLALAVHAIGYLDVRRAIASGRLVRTPFGPMHPFPFAELGVNPDVTYLYVRYTLRPGQTARLEWAGCDAPYWAFTLYDLDLQHLDTPSHLSHRDRSGPVVATVGVGGDLDCGDTRDGVLVLRVIGGHDVPLPVLHG